MKYIVTHRITAHHELEVVADSPEEAALVAIGWTADPRTGCWVFAALTDENHPDVIVMDPERSPLLHMATGPYSGEMLNIDSEKEEFEGAFDDRDIEQRRG